MIDGLYQSVVLFFAAYLLFSPTKSVTTNGENIDDRERFGIYIGCAAIFVINFYILMNTYRWDWLMVLVTAVSILLVWFWTGVYSAFTSSSIPFYKAGAEVFSQPSYWVLTVMSILVCLLPRFSIKVIQKTYFPYDIDIIREQVQQGKFAHLDKKPELFSLMDVDESGGSPAMRESNRVTDQPDADERPTTDESIRPNEPLQTQVTQASMATDLTHPQFRVEQSVESFI